MMGLMIYFNFVLFYSVIVELFWIGIYLVINGFYVEFVKVMNCVWVSFDGLVFE